MSNLTRLFMLVTLLPAPPCWHTSTANLLEEELPSALSRFFSIAGPRAAAPRPVSC